MVIENKVFSSEGEDQLNRYKRTVRAKYPNWRHMFIYLTPDGHLPSDDEYITFDYSDMSDLLSRVISEKSRPVPDDVATIIRHYVEMLRRNIVQDK